MDLQQDELIIMCMVVIARQGIRNSRDVNKS
jgi:hypothetical protein